jgi:hypothetical protein
MDVDWLLASCRCKEATSDAPGQRPRQQLMPLTLPWAPCTAPRGNPAKKTRFCGACRVLLKPRLYVLHLYR